jgi:photosystem II stability/assembly factor-like uncharacterized protein
MRSALKAAAMCCGLFVCAAAAQTNPLPARTMERLLLTDAHRSGSRVVAVGDRGYIVVSDDEGRTWRRAGSPEAPLLTAVDFSADATGLAVGHDAVILATSDGGKTWTQVFAAPAEQRPLLDVIHLSKDTAIAIGAYGAYYESADAGRSWNARKIIADDKHLNAILRVSDARLLILGEAGTILASNDAGKTWTPVASPYKGSFFGGVVAADGSVVAFGLRGRIYRSTDGGDAWTQVQNASLAAIMSGERLPDGAIVLAGAAGTALVSRDNGQSFVPVETGTTRALAKAVLGAANQLLLLGEAGVRAVPLATSARRAP